MLADRPPAQGRVALVLQQTTSAKYLEPLDKPSVVKPADQQGLKMGPGYFVIAILGCADGGSACTPVATLQTRYESAEQCAAATVPALEANSNFDYPTLL